MKIYVLKYKEKLYNMCIIMKELFMFFTFTFRIAME